MRLHMGLGIEENPRAPYGWRDYWIALSLLGMLYLLVIAGVAIVSANMGPIPIPAPV